jgi:large subunit ribosomal protein L21
MYAVIEDSGTQFKVGKGDIIRVDLRDLAEDQTEIEFDKVMLVSGDTPETPKIGTPYVEGAKVKAEVLTEVRGEKITIIKYKRRKGYRRKRGHRQSFLRIRVTDIAA